MQKILQILFVTSCAIFGTVNAGAYDLSIDDMIEIYGPYLVGCNAERSHYEEVFKYVEEPSHEAKCFQFCCFKTFKLVTDDNKLIEDKAIAMAGQLFENKEKELNEIVQKCNIPPAGVTDICEISHVIFFCMFHEAKSYGFKIPEFSN